MQIKVTKRFRRCVRHYSESQQAEISRIIELVGNCFGMQHLHSGLGIRKLGKDIFEARVGLDIRLVFIVEGKCLMFFGAGNHDQIKTFLRNL